MGAQSKTLSMMWSNVLDAAWQQLGKAMDPVRELLERNMGTLIGPDGKSGLLGRASAWFGRFVQNVITDGQALWRAFQSGGVDGLVHKLGEMTGLGPRLDGIWKHIKQDGPDVVKVFSEWWDAVSNLAQIFGPFAYGALTVAEGILHWMADHPDAASGIFTSLALVLTTYKIVSLLWAIVEAIGGIGAAAVGAAEELGLLGETAMITVGEASAAAGVGGAGAGAAAGRAGVGGALAAAGGGTGLAAKAGIAGLAAVAAYEGAKGLHAIWQGLVKGTHVPGFAEGGTVISPGLVRVGEKGRPELLHLPAGASVTPLAQDNPMGLSRQVVFEDGAIRISGTDVLNSQRVADILIEEIQTKIARS
jgi:hypothetical protein